MNRKVTFKETVELFLTTIIYDIVNEIETPRINFIFKDEAYNLFNEIKNNPLKLPGWKPNIKDEDINFLKNSINYNYPSIYIKDHIKFFTYLTEITNNNIKLHNKYKEDKISRKHLIYILKRIWLRMSPNDLNNIESFLKTQLLFNTNDILEKYKFNRNTEHIIDYYHNYKVIAENSLNNTWNESNKHMSFKIITENYEHSLPNIHYDIKTDCCYIYAIQNENKPNKIPKINKLIYKEFKGISQPNKVYALKLFIKILKEIGIKTIKVPTIQVLNYDYHKILSKEIKHKINNLWPVVLVDNLNSCEQIEYENDLIWYNKIADKEDIISKIKTEDLINLIYKIVNEDKNLIITNDIDISDTLDIKIKYLK